MAKVIHIVPGKANINRLNGVNKVVYSVAMESIKAGKDVEVWGIATDDKNTHNHPFPFRIFVCNLRYFSLNSQLKEAIREQPQGTVFHLHGVLIPAYSAFTRLLRQLKYSYVVTPHGALLKRSLRRGAWYKYLYFYLFEYRLLKRAKVVHCITAQEKEQLQAICSAVKIKIIPNGTHSVPLGESNRLHDEPLFLYMGRFDKQHKGLDIALKAFGIFYQKYRKGRFILTGDGPDKNRLKKIIASHRLDPFVILLPPQYGADKDDLLAKTDIFVHPSRWDVMPTSCLEAAMAGKPLIVSRATGMAYKVEQAHAGWATMTKHPSELAQKFRLAYKAWADGKIINMSANARQMIMDNDLLWPSLIHHYYKKLYSHD
jgi:glycosyltransferase involved in cell wall biosynthesis